MQGHAISDVANGTPVLVESIQSVKSYADGFQKFASACTDLGYWQCGSAQVSMWRHSSLAVVQESP